MSGKADIKNALKKLVAPNGDAYSVICTVDSVDLAENTCYCVAKNGTGDIQNVRLMALNTNGFLIVPEVGSDVMVSFMSDSSAYVSLFSDISEIQLNGENYLGLVKITELKTALNLLQTDINTLKTAITALMAGYAPIDGGVALAAFNAIVLGQINVSALENTTVKHGNG